MVILITGASHTGKTMLAQRILEQCRYPYLCMDHIKMGLIRSGNTELTPEDDEALVSVLWPICREIIRTAIENHQNLVVEGCYVPFSWRREFDEDYLKSIKFICLGMTDKYIEEHFYDIAAHESDIEYRAVDTDISIEGLKKENERYIKGFRAAGERVVLVGLNHAQTILGLARSLSYRLPTKK
ncbi:MAG: adenylate kinase [Firmicutes bacterium]|nr:adenylate kinase [Bacillota bacterium]